jgi:tetratricopeptide (TPR) repeat protein
MVRKWNSGRLWLVCSLLVLAVIAVYLPVIRLSFLAFDDDYYVTANPHVSAGLTSAGLRWAFTQAHSANWHPLTWFSHMLDCQLYGLRPAGHHLTNVLFHAANSVVLFLWLRSLTGTCWRSAFVAALFALHPLHVESVAWVAERKDVLCAFFGLLSLWAYMRYAQKSLVSSRWSAANSQQAKDHAQWTTDHGSRFTLNASSFYLFSLFLFALGLMSKPMLVTWPFVMLLLDYWPLGRMQNDERRMMNKEPDTMSASRRGHVQGSSSFLIHPSSLILLEKLPFFALSAASCVITVVAQKAGGAMVTLQTLPFWQRVINAADSYLRYLGHLFWPADLAAIYTSTNWSAVELSLAVGLLIGITLVGVWQRKRRPYLLVGWFWYLGTLVPVIGLVQVGNQTMADRYTYLPTIGVFLMVAWSSAELAGKWKSRSSWDASPKRPLPRGDGDPSRMSLPGRACLAAAAIATLSACAVVAHHQLRFWQSSESLFRHALSVDPNNFVAWTGLGYWLAEQGQAGEAEACYRAAVQIRPSFAEAWNGLGCALANSGRYAEAVTNYETAVHLSPGHIKARDNLAAALAACGRIEEAKAQCREAARVDPGAAEPHSNLAALLARQGRWEQAVTEYRLALDRDPSLLDARCGLAGALAKAGKPEEGMRELSNLLELQPTHRLARLQLGSILARQGKTDQAVAEFSELLHSNPDDAEAHYHLGLALSAQGKPREALAHYRAALKTRPEYLEALNNLAWLLATQPDPQLRDGTEAVRLSERACQLTDYKQALMLGTLGAAYAEAGRFPEAIEAAHKAKALAEQENDNEVAAMNAKLLAFYLARQPYRESR